MSKSRSFILLFILICLFFLDLWIGSVYISISDLFSVLTGHSEDIIYHSIIISKRLPHTFVALISGIALSVSGLIMQTIFRNPLAGPFVLGVSSGANLGVAILLLGTTGITIGLPVAATIGAMSVLLIISLFANKINSSSTILIIGLMLSYFVSAFTSFLISISTAEEIQSFSIWGLGSFSKVSYSELALISVISLLGLSFFFIQSKKLNLYLLGDQYAVSLGVNVKVLRIMSVLIVGAISGIVTAYCGPIAFVGMAVPHLSRSFSKYAHHTEYISNSIFIGGIFTLFCDIISETPFYAQMIPINSLTCLLGAPIVIWVLYKLKPS